MNPDALWVVDYFGEDFQMMSLGLGESQHSEPWCLLVFGYDEMSTKSALQDITDFLWEQLPVSPIAIAPDYYIYDSDPSIRSFDTDCSDNSQLAEEAARSKSIPETHLRAYALANSPLRPTGQGIRIAMLDGGVGQAEEFLRRDGFSKHSRRFLEADFPTLNGSHRNIQDDFDCADSPHFDGHGSLVERIIERIAPESELLSLKVCDVRGLCNTSSITKALLYLRNNYQGLPPIDIVNMSFGGDIEENWVFESLLHDMMDNQSSPLFIASVGNHPEDNSHFPAQYQSDYPNVLAVAAAKQDRQNLSPQLWQLADFNTRSVLWHDNRPPLAAPGVRIELENLGNPQGVSGTSFAAPYVAALAALTLELHPHLTSTELRELLTLSADSYPRFSFARLPHVNQ